MMTSEKLYQRFLLTVLFSFDFFSFLIAFAKKYDNRNHERKLYLTEKKLDYKISFLIFDWWKEFLQFLNRLELRPIQHFGWLTYEKE
jgi:hypothetical protein